MAKKIVALIVSLSFLCTISCQSYRYGPPQTMATKQAAVPFGNNASEFETFGEKEGDPIGQWLVIGIVGAIAVGSAVLVPLYLNDKL